MRLISIMTRGKYVLPISIDLDKCEKIGTYLDSYPQSIGRPGSPCSTHITKSDTITVYKTYGKLIGTELEYITCVKNADTGALTAFPATGDDLVKINYEFLGNWKNNKLLCL